MVAVLAVLAVLTALAVLFVEAVEKEEEEAEDVVATAVVACEAAAATVVSTNAEAGAEEEEEEEEEVEEEEEEEEDDDDAAISFSLCFLLDDLEEDAEGSDCAVHCTPVTACGPWALTVQTGGEPVDAWRRSNMCMLPFSVPTASCRPSGRKVIELIPSFEKTKSAVLKSAPV